MTDEEIVQAASQVLRGMAIPLGTAEDVVMATRPIIEAEADAQAAKLVAVICQMQAELDVFTYEPPCTCDPEGECLDGGCEACWELPENVPCIGGAR